MSYFICRRAFRDAKGPVSTGSVIDPVEIKRFRFRLQEGHIVEVTEQNFEQYATLFEQRYGITIPKLDEISLVESEKAEVETEEKAEVETEEKAEVETEEKAEVETEEKAEVETEEKAEVKESTKAKAKPTVAKATAKAKVTENK